MLRTIIDHLKSQWYKYVLEIIVVFVGILIAFNLDQWQDFRSNRKEEINILKEFKAALSADLSEMKGNIR